MGGFEDIQICSIDYAGCFQSAYLLIQLCLLQNSLLGDWPERAAVLRIRNEKWRCEK
jgi:hypothetical protein